MNARLLRPSIPVFMTEHLVGLLITQMYCTLNPVHRTGAVERSYLDNVEEVAELQYGPAIDPNLDGMLELMKIIEKLYLNIRKRFSESDRLSYAGFGF